MVNENEGCRGGVFESELLSGQTRERELQRKYSNQGKITTLMLRNIPFKYTPDMLLEELIDCMGSLDVFDFFYLPWDQQNDSNIGYAFVNFRTVGAAERCTRIFTNFSFRRFDSPKCCKVFPAHIQGLENNVLHLMDRAVSEARSHYPIIMWKGKKLKLGKVIAVLESQCMKAAADEKRREEYRHSPLSALAAQRHEREYRHSPLSAPAAPGLDNTGYCSTFDQPWAGAQSAPGSEETAPIFEEDQGDEDGWDSLEAQLASCLRRHRQEMAAKQRNEMMLTNRFGGADAVCDSNSLDGCQDRSDRPFMDAIPFQDAGSQHNGIQPQLRDPLSYGSGMELLAQAGPGGPGQKGAFMGDEMKGHVIEPRNPTDHVLQKFWQKFGR